MAWNQTRDLSVKSLIRKLLQHVHDNLSRGVARNLIWVAKMLTSDCKETKQPHKKFKVDWLGGGIYTDIPPSRRYAPDSLVDWAVDLSTDLWSQMTWAAVCIQSNPWRTYPPADVALRVCAVRRRSLDFRWALFTCKHWTRLTSNCCTESLQSECHPDLSAARSSSSFDSISQIFKLTFRQSLKRFFCRHKSGFLVAVRCRRCLGGLSSFMRTTCPVHRSCAVRRKASIPAVCSTCVFGFFSCHLTFSATNTKHHKCFSAVLQFCMKTHQVPRLENSKPE